MLDSLDKFDTTTDGNIVFKSHPSETAVMREYVAPLAQQALAIFSEKYKFTPKGPILIEMFPKHDDFAVRTVGLPGMIGALGACFGRVVTLDSPKARPPGDFNWAPTLWHELAHVMTLQLSKQRVPRWLTEGISTYEEKLGSPGLGARRGTVVCRRLRAGRTYDGARAERRVPGSREDFAGVLPGVDPHRTHRRQVRHGRASQAARHVWRRARGRGRAEGGAGSRHRYAAGRFRQITRGEIRLGGARAEAAERARAREGESRSHRIGVSRQLPGAGGARRISAEGGAHRRGVQGARARGRDGADGDRPAKPARDDGADGARAERQRARDQRAREAASAREHRSRLGAAARAGARGHAGAGREADVGLRARRAARSLRRGEPLEARPPEDAGGRRAHGRARVPRGDCRRLARSGVRAFRSRGKLSGRGRQSAGAPRGPRRRSKWRQGIRARRSCC